MLQGNPQNSFSEFFYSKDERRGFLRNAAIKHGVASQKTAFFTKIRFYRGGQMQMLVTGKVKANPVTGRGGPEGCERLRLPHFLDNRLTDGGEVVSITHRPPFNSQEDSWYSFLLRGTVDPRAMVRLEGLGQLIKSTSSGLDPATFWLVS
jgi:hypothetical protein